MYVENGNFSHHFLTIFRAVKLEWWGYKGKKFENAFSRFHAIHKRDRHPDRRIPRHSICCAMHRVAQQKQIDIPFLNLTDSLKTRHVMW